MALLVVLRAMLERSWPASATEAPWASAERAFRRALSIAPGVGIALHLWGAGWVYQLPFTPSGLGPVLIALGVRQLLLNAKGPEPVWGWRLPLLGIGLSWLYPPELEVIGPGGLVLSPFRLALFAAGASFILGFQMYREVRQLAAAISCLTGAALGHSLGVMAGSAADILRTILSLPRRVAPRSAQQWGVLAVGSAFLLLALGARVSLLKRRQEAPRRYPKP